MLDRRAFLSSSLALTAMASSAARARAAPLAPFRLYDTHAHFYTSDTRRYPLAADITPAARAKALQQPTTAEAIFRMWDDAGVEMGCGVQYNTTYSTDNRYLLDCAERFPRRISPIVILGPDDPVTPGALRSMAKAYGVSGVRFAGLPDAQDRFVFLEDASRAAWETANDLELVVVLMPRRSPQAAAIPAAMKRVGELAARYPKVNIVLDHIGYPVAARNPTFGLSPEHLALKAHRNVYYKHTSFLIEILKKEGGAPPKDFLEYVVDHYGADRMMWGSDIGNSPGDFRELAQMALDSAQGLTPAQRKAIFHDTAKGLFTPGGRARTPGRQA